MPVIKVAVVSKRNKEGRGAAVALNFCL